MNNYLWYGNNLNNLINHSEYVFITGFGEFIGMLIFIFMLVSTIANISLPKSRAYSKKGYGWIVIGIAIGLLIALFSSFAIQYGIFNSINKNITYEIAYNMVQLNLNPAIVIANMFKGTNLVSGYLPLVNGLIYIFFELLGAISGAFLSYIFFKRLMKNEEVGTIQGCFFTTPCVKNKYANFFNEFFATLIFMIAIISVSIGIENQLYLVKLTLISLVVMGIGYGVGGVTGYALNPIRDFGPKLAYFFIWKNKDKNIDWKYSLIPTLGPIFGCLIATLIMPGWLY